MHRCTILKSDARRQGDYQPHTTVFLRKQSSLRDHIGTEGKSEKQAEILDEEGSRSIYLIPGNINRSMEISRSAIIFFSAYLHEQYAKGQLAVGTKIKLPRYNFEALKLLIKWVNGERVKMATCPPHVLVQCSGLARKWKMPFLQKDVMFTMWSLFIKFPNTTTHGFLAYVERWSGRRSAMRQLIMDVCLMERQQLRFQPPHANNLDKNSHKLSCKYYSAWQKEVEEKEKSYRVLVINARRGKDKRDYPFSGREATLACQKMTPSPRSCSLLG